MPCNIFIYDPETTQHPSCVIMYIVLLESMADASLEGCEIPMSLVTSRTELPINVSHLPQLPWGLSTGLHFSIWGSYSCCLVGTIKPQNEYSWMFILAENLREILSYVTNSLKYFHIKWTYVSVECKTCMLMEKTVTTRNFP